MESRERIHHYEALVQYRKEENEAQSGNSGGYKMPSMPKMPNSSAPRMPNMNVPKFR